MILPWTESCSSCLIFKCHSAFRIPDRQFVASRIAGRTGTLFPYSFWDDRGNVIGIVSAKLDASAALAASGQLPENVNYAVKSSLLLSFLESVPDVDAKLKAPNTVDEKFEDVVKSAQDAAVLVLVY
jgi:hypothetical protein